MNVQDIEKGLKDHAKKVFEEISAIDANSKEHRYLLLLLKCWVEFGKLTLGGAPLEWAMDYGLVYRYSSEHKGDYIISFTDFGSSVLNQFELETKRLPSSKSYSSGGP